MGHLALIAYEEADGTYTARYSQWDAHDARLLGTPWKPPGDGRSGDRAIAGDLPDRVAVAHHVDFLYHEAVYVVARDGAARAFDTAWWRGADAFRDGPLSGQVGVGALVELRTSDEWGEYATELYHESESMTAREFHEAARDRWAERIPPWSPLGGERIQIPDGYPADDQPGEGWTLNEGEGEGGGGA